MTNQALIIRLTELVDKMTAYTLALSPKHIVDEQLDKELSLLTEKSQISMKHSQAAMGLIAGLYLWNGNLDRSHTISQDLESRTGSYLHGILHRMEPDYPNAKYWFRMAGGHPDGEQVQQETLKLLSGHEVLYQRFSHYKTWNPGLLTDIVEEALEKSRDTEEITLLEQIQAIELRLLLTGVLQSIS